VTPSGTYEISSPIANVTIMGLPTAPKSVAFNNAKLAVGSWAYDTASRVLAVKGLEATTTGGAWNSSWEMSWE
jgi:alpha-glucosidase